MSSIGLRVVGWTEWPGSMDGVAHSRNILVSMLRSSTPMGHVEAKRLVRAILDKREAELLLVDPSMLQGIRNALESIGAVVEVFVPSA